MDIWFVRSNGETAHNQPGTTLYVQGEPPNYPERRYNYRETCLEGGFARIGWPAAGDLRQLGWRTRAREAYGPGLSSQHMGYLECFAGIRVGDVVLIPADEGKYMVHVGRVEANASQPLGRAGWGPYFYQFDISNGDWFEVAHRVPVAWYRDRQGRYLSIEVPRLGGNWLKALGRVEAAKQDVIDALGQFEPTL